MGGRDNNQQSMQLTCENCRGSVSLPGDLAALSVACSYCGREILLPESLVAERKQQYEKAQRRALEMERSRQDAEVKKTAQKHTTRRVIIIVSVSLLMFGTIFGYVQYVIHSTKDTRSKDPAFTGMTAAGQWLARRKAEGCAYVVTQPELMAGGFTWEAKLQQAGDCVDVVTVTGDVANPINMVMRTPDIQQIAGTRNGTWTEIIHCGRMTGTYPVSVTPTNNNYYTFAAVACPRRLYEAPKPTDPVSTGEAEVAARMKSLYQKGCRQVVQPAKKVNGDTTWTSNFADAKTANCLDIIVATGIPTNTLTLTMTTPFGETLQTPAPGLVIDYLYCPETGGPHPVNITAADTGDYTFAAIDCPLHIAKKMLKKR